MTFNAANRLRSLEDRSAAPGSSRCELPGMHSVPKSAVLPYASGVGGLSRRLLNLFLNIRYIIHRFWYMVYYLVDSTWYKILKDPSNPSFLDPPCLAPENQNLGSLCLC